VHGCHAALAQKALDRVAIGERVGEGSRLSPALEELHRSLVFFRGRETPERAEIPTAPRLRILFAGIESILSRFEFANHLCSRSA
jgi:hypothetical protein